MAHERLPCMPWKFAVSCCIRISLLHIIAQWIYFRFTVYVNNHEYSYTIRPFWPLDTWSKYTWIYLGDGDTQRGIKIYKDGALAGEDNTFSSSSRTGQSAHLTMARHRLNVFEYGNLDIDSFVAWDAVLTDQQIAPIHQWSQPKPSVTNCVTDNKIELFIFPSSNDGKVQWSRKRCSRFRFWHEPPWPIKCDRRRAWP